MEIALILEVENTNVVSYKPEDSGSTQIGTKHVHDCISMYVVILVRGLDFARLPAAKYSNNMSFVLFFLAQDMSKITKYR